MIDNDFMPLNKTYHVL